MAGFQRLTRADLTRLTRHQLLDRIEAEQQYWERKAKRGGWTPEDRFARLEFSYILHAAFEPSGFADSMAEDAAWLRGERKTSSQYWDEIPGLPDDKEG